MATKTSWEQCNHEPVSSRGEILSLSLFVLVKYHNEMIVLLSRGRRQAILPQISTLLTVLCSIVDLNSPNDERREERGVAEWMN